MSTLAWVLAGGALLGATGAFVNATRCPTRHWMRGRCVRRLGHRGEHLAAGHAWSTAPFPRRLSR